MKDSEFKDYLDKLVNKYENPAFIPNDPISIPHQFEKKADIEIIAFFIATISWGRRSEIIRKGNILVNIMNGSPLEFVNSPTDKQLQELNKYVYRTFQPVDAIYFHHFLNKHYQKHDSLEDAFIRTEPYDDVKHDPIAQYLGNFHHYFMETSQAEKRTKKHIANPCAGSGAKRLNMFLRWMVRSAEKGVDFGLWTRISPSELHLPLDVHVGRVARNWGLINRKQNDWKAVLELSESVRKYDDQDPGKYDFALFGYALDPS